MDGTALLPFSLLLLFPPLAGRPCFEQLCGGRKTFSRCSCSRPGEALLIELLSVSPRSQKNSMAAREPRQQPVQGPRGINPFALVAKCQTRTWRPRARKCRGRALTQSLGSFHLTYLTGLLGDRFLSDKLKILCVFM